MYTSKSALPHSPTQSVSVCLSLSLSLSLSCCLSISRSLSICLSLSLALSHLSPSVVNSNNTECDHQPEIESQQLHLHCLVTVTNYSVTHSLSLVSVCFCSVTVSVSLVTVCYCSVTVTSVSLCLTETKVALKQPSWLTGL